MSHTGTGDQVGSTYQGSSKFTGDENILINVEGVVHESATVLLASSGEYKPGLALKNGGAGDVRIPYLNTDTIGEVSGESILNETIIITSTSGGQETVKVLVGGSVKLSKVKDRDGNEVDAAFQDHKNMKNVRFSYDS